MSFKMLAAVDLDAPSAIPLIKRAQQFASLQGADLSVLHVVERGQRITFRGASAEMPIDPTEMEEASEGWRLRLNENLEAPLEQNQLRLRTGLLGEQISQEIIDNEIELLILGAETRHAIKLFFEGGGTERLARQAPCDVLVISRQNLGINAQE